MRTSHALLRPYQRVFPVSLTPYVHLPQSNTSLFTSLVTLRELHVWGCTSLMATHFLSHPLLFHRLSQLLCTSSPLEPYDTDHVSENQRHERHRGRHRRLILPFLLVALSDPNPYFLHVP